MDRTAGWPSIATTCCAMRPTAKIAACGGFTMAWKKIDSEHTEIADGEGSVGNVIGPELTGLSAFHQL